MNINNFFSLDEDFMKGKKEHGSVKMKKYINTMPATNTAAEYNRYENIEVALTQDPYIDGKRDEKPVFKAAGVDADGNEYDITWNVVENWEEVAENGDDQQMVKDWDSPVSVERV